MSVSDSFPILIIHRKYFFFFFAKLFISQVLKNNDRVSSGLGLGLGLDERYV